MFLILSAAYVGQEIQSEFGQIPPSFLPLGNRRLFQHQIKLAPKGVAVYLSIPESYQVSPTDSLWLDSHNVTLIRTPENISLGASLVAALNLSEHNLNSPLHILFGDTMFTELPTGDDIVCVSEINDSYNWAVVCDNELSWIKDNNQNKIESSSKNIVNGYFKFSEPRQLIKSITQSNWDFLSGLNIYHQNIGLTSAFSNKWLDFGHVNTYYRSKASYTTQRSFNELTITPDWVEKSSIKNNKIAAEANWFSQLPFSLRLYIPQYLGSQENEQQVSYRLEYLHNTALNELYVFSELPVIVWEKILKSCIKFIHVCLQEKTPSGLNSINKLSELFNSKTSKRVHEYCKSKSISIYDKWYFGKNETPLSLNEIILDSQKYLPLDDDEWPLSILHGDFCFSNILYDFRTERIKTIDPRGITPDGSFTIYGDVRYDIAKLSHSIIGMYDWIIAGYYKINIELYHIEFVLDENDRHKIIQQRFIELIFKEFGISGTSLIAMQIQLFLSMLPLHCDDNRRQQALFANAFRLYYLMKRIES